jgi:serine/threonine protein kinase
MAFFCIECKREIPRDVRACPHCGELVTETLRKYLEKPIDGKYRIVERLGRGGMGEVYKAIHVHLDAVRVLKLMRPNLSDQKSAHQRFIREAKLATRIHHPNVSTLHDFSTLPDGGYYMVWEFIDGINLTQYLQKQGPLSPQHTARLAIQALHGLEAIHRAGIVHRDVSPDNLMIVNGAGGEEELKIIDLGIAKKDDDRSTDQTRAGVFMGKLKYCSPEHIGMLEPGERIDGRADIYSMGLLMYEMLTGQPAIVASSPHQYVIAHSTHDPKPLREVNPVVRSSPELEALLFKAMQKERENRFGSAREFAHALEEILPNLASGSETPEDEPTVSLSAPPSFSAPSAHAASAVWSAAAPLEEQAERHAAAEEQGSQPTVASAAAPSSALAVAGLVLVIVAIVGLAFAGYVVWRYSRSADEVGVKDPQQRHGAAITVTSVAHLAPTAAAAAPSAALVPAPDATAVAEVSAPSPAVSPSIAVRPVAVAPPPRTELSRENITVAPMAGPSAGDVEQPVPAADPRPVTPPGTIIVDASRMRRDAGVNLAWISPGIKLSRYRIRVRGYENATPYSSPQVLQYLMPTLQEELEGISRPSDPALFADGLIYWAEWRRGERRGLGVEMVFRDSSGSVVAELRHRIIENSPEDAAEEMVEAITDFVEDHRVR